jgi:hypothetical protein
LTVKAPPPPPSLFGAAVTATVAVAVAVVPVVPVQLMEKVVAAVSAPLAWLPDVVGRVPLHPVALGLEEAVQLVVLLELHTSVACAPEVTLEALAIRVTVGAGETLMPYNP